MSQGPPKYVVPRHRRRDSLAGLAPYRVSQLGVARTFQDLRLIGKLTVRENVLLSFPQNPGEHFFRALLPPRFNIGYTVASSLRVSALLSDFFLMDIAHQPASEISYGQQKLLTLACCAAMDANLLLLDEPVAGISPEYRGRIAERLASFRTAGKTILLIEHQPDFLERVGERFLFLESGQLHAFDTFAALRVAHEALN